MQHNKDEKVCVAYELNEQVKWVSQNFRWYDFCCIIYNFLHVI